MIPIKHILHLTIALALVCVSCSTAPTESAGSETTNGVTVTAAASTVEGATSSGAAVYLYAADQTPLAPGYGDTAIADAAGEFAFSQVPPGQYNLFVYPQTDSMAAIVQGIAVGIFGPKSDSADFAKTSEISGVVKRNDTLQAGVHVYIAGSPFYDITDTNGAFALENIAAGLFAVAAYQSVRNQQAFADSQTIDMQPAQTTKHILNFDLEPVQ